jgi:predicted PurR-regulated permease PerM
MKLHPLQITTYIVIVGAGLKLTAPIINLILLALLLAGSLMPVIIWLMKKRVPKSVAILSTVLLLIIITMIIGSAVSVAVVGIADKIPQYEVQLNNLRNNTIQFFGALGMDISDIRSIPELNPGKILEVATGFIAGVISTFSNFSIVVLLIIFLLIDAADLRYRIDKGDKKISAGWQKLEELFVEIRKYLSISAFTGLITAIGNLILLLSLGVEFPFLWAFLSFLFSFIPSIGFILSVLPPALLALLDLGLTESIIVAIGFILINAIVENVVKPKVMGEELNLSLFVIFVSLIVWTWILGAIGAILAIPLTISAMKAWEILFSKE